MPDTEPASLPSFLQNHAFGCGLRRGSTCDCGLDLRMRELASAFEDLAGWSRGLYDQLLPNHRDTDKGTS